VGRGEGVPGRGKGCTTNLKVGGGNALEGVGVNTVITLTLEKCGGA